MEGVSVGSGLAGRLQSFRSQWKTVKQSAGIQVHGRHRLFPENQIHEKFTGTSLRIENLHHHSGKTGGIECSFQGSYFEIIQQTWNDAHRLLDPGAGSEGSRPD